MSYLWTFTLSTLLIAFLQCLELYWIILYYNASRHYVGTVAVDLPSTTKNSSIPSIIYSPHRFICTLSVDLYFGHFKKTLIELNWIECTFAKCPNNRFVFFQNYSQNVGNYQWTTLPQIKWFPSYIAISQGQGIVIHGRPHSFAAFTTTMMMIKYTFSCTVQLAYTYHLFKNVKLVADRLNYKLKH